MTISQLEYLIALDEHRHFATAAEACHITQPTLSMQLRKLEESLGEVLFDRSRTPVIPTEAGEAVIAQARRVLHEAAVLRSFKPSHKAPLQGELRIGIIPTLAPYLLPLVLQKFATAYPQVRLVIRETITASITDELRRNRFDAGILATPLSEPSLSEQPLFQEALFAYVPAGHQLSKKKYVLPRDLDTGEVLLLEEGHCLRSQMLQLCTLRKQQTMQQVSYESGSIETLRRMVDRGQGITILPELAALELPQKRKLQLIPFRSPVPVRQISLVMHRSTLKERLVKAFADKLMEVLPDEILRKKSSEVLDIL